MVVIRAGLGRALKRYLTPEAPDATPRHDDRPHARERLRPARALPNVNLLDPAGNRRRLWTWSRASRRAAVLPRLVVPEGAAFLGGCASGRTTSDQIASESAHGDAPAGHVRQCRQLDRQTHGPAASRKAPGEAVLA
jgi:hypothetical protein